jgi:hypothetical protein
MAHQSIASFKEVAQGYFCQSAGHRQANHSTADNGDVSSLAVLIHAATDL